MNADAVLPVRSGAEWLEADGSGGFASGRADGVRTRRYHALLLTATTPPTGRVVLVNGVDALVRTAEGEVAISSQRYAPDVTHPDGASRLVRFAREPWPTWTYRLPSGAEVVHELFVPRGRPLVALSWRLTDPDAGVLVVRPFLSGRDTHATHHENDAFEGGATVAGGRVRWRPYAGLPAVDARTNARYAPEFAWYRQFQYDDERARGLDYLEDLVAPGTFTFEAGGARAVLLFEAVGDAASDGGDAGAPAEDEWAALADEERRRRGVFHSPLHRAAADYVVRRGAGKTVIAGYPWFSDWGRDTFLALRGLCIAGAAAERSGRLVDARDILLEWSRYVSEGMLPNYFPEGGAEPEYNAVDASLWYVVAVHDLLRAARGGRVIASGQRRALLDAVERIVSGYAAGTRFGIRADDSGLLAAGVPGVQLTWMDARVDGRVITPRVGKPVEVQALWINALRVAGQQAPHWGALADRAQAAFAARFWSEAHGHLYDVVDVDHVPGTVDATLRPNQLLAVGGLPWPLLDGDRARRVVDVAEARLWTPAGPRSLAPGEPGYVAHYGGGVAARDGAYHQGTVWPWLAGPFIDAWVRVRGGTPEARQEARTRFLLPLLHHYEADGGGHLPEVADAEPPHAAGGCPFQAWSVAEVLRVVEEVLAPDPRAELPAALAGEASARAG